MSQCDGIQVESRAVNCAIYMYILHRCDNCADHCGDVTKGNASIIITGDFNIYFLEINEWSEFQKYFDIFVTYGMFPKTTVSTRSNKSNASLIDQIFCKLKIPKQHLLFFVVKSSLSDQLPYISVFDLLKTVTHRPNFVKINRSDEDSFKAFDDEVHSSLLNSNMNPDLFCDPNENFKQFEEINLNAKAKYLGPKLVRLKKHKRKLSPLMTTGILNSMKFRDKLYLKLKSLDPGTDHHHNIDSDLKSYNTILKKSSSDRRKYNIILSNLTKTNQTLDILGLLLKKF